MGIPLCRLSISAAISLMRSKRSISVSYTHLNDGVMYVTTRMQKTKDIVHNPISEEALELIGYSPEDVYKRQGFTCLVAFMAVRSEVVIA